MECVQRSDKKGSKFGVFPEISHVLKVIDCHVETMIDYHEGISAYMDYEQRNCEMEDVRSEFLEGYLVGCASQLLYMA